MEAGSVEYEYRYVHRHDGIQFFDTIFWAVSDEDARGMIRLFKGFAPGRILIPCCDGEKLFRTAETRVTLKSALADDRSWTEIPMSATEGEESEEAVQEEVWQEEDTHNRNIYRYSCVLHEENNDLNFPFEKMFAAASDKEAKEQADDFNDAFGTLGLTISDEKLEEVAAIGSAFTMKRVVAYPIETAEAVNK
ncbi:MAG: hypothetical protein Q8P49_02130 [Candidatus Liptonbacteria bacterium]|nr:hypothetical protein [Candidatus Liptonbacteria bacterium]